MAEKKKLKRNEPLGLPKGTVRACITILVLVMFCVAAILEMFYGSKVPDTLSAITLTVVAYYFGTRSIESKLKSSDDMVEGFEEVS